MTKRIQKNIRYLTYLFAAAVSCLTLTGCKGDDPYDPEQPQKKKRTILVYAVANNNLSYNLEGASGDKAEMIRGAEYYDTDCYSLLLFQVLPGQDPALLELQKKDADGTAEFVKLRSYDRTRYSTDPSCISDIIADALELRPSDSYGMIFWSHASSWTPDFNDHTLPDTETMARMTNRKVSGNTVSIETVHSFGEDKIDGKKDSIDIDQLADALPDGIFDFIWFDCCYMSGIEVLYQFRNKADYIVAYPTEIAAEGMPYHLTLPMLMSENINLTGAADQLADYFSYSTEGIPYTVAVCRTSELEEVADAAKKLYESGRVPAVNGLQKYSRTPCGPFYDFVQYTTLYPREADQTQIDRLNNAMSKLVIYKSASDKDFNGRMIKKENFSGVSCHYYYNNIGDRNQYYSTLDWTRRVYPPIK